MSQVLEIADTSSVDAAVGEFTDKLPPEVDYTITLTCTYDDLEAGKQHGVEETHIFNAPTPAPTLKWALTALDWMYEHPQDPGVQIQLIYTREQNSVSIDQTQFPP